MEKPRPNTSLYEPNTSLGPEKEMGRKSDKRGRPAGRERSWAADGAATPASGEPAALGVESDSGARGLKPATQPQRARDLGQGRRR